MWCHCPCSAIAMQCCHPYDANACAMPSPVQPWCPCRVITQATLTSMQSHSPCSTHAHACPQPPGSQGSLTAHLAQRQVGASYAVVFVSLRVEAPPHPLLVGVLRTEQVLSGARHPQRLAGAALGREPAGAQRRAGAGGRDSLPGRAPPWPWPRCVPALSPATPSPGLCGVGAGEGWGRAGGKGEKID